MAIKTTSKHKKKKKPTRPIKRKKRRRLAITMPKSALGAPSLGSKEFAALQATWYDKLAKSGFDDIEWCDEATGRGQNSDYLKRPDQERIKHVKLNTYEYYRLCTNYYTHNTKWKSKYYKYIWELYCHGTTYRQIMKLANKRFKPYGERHTLYYIHHVIKYTEALCMQWNKEHAEGLLNPNNVDFYIDDVPLRGGL